MGAETDRQLVERIRHGDIAAFEVIVVRYRAALVALVDSRLHSLADAEDVAQEAFVQAFLHLPELRDPDALLPWLRRVADRLALMRLRLRRDEPISPEHLDRIGGSPVDEGGVVNGVGLRGLLVGLPVPMRQAVALTCLAGYTCAEAARLLGVKEGTVKSRLSRARAQLKEAIAMSDREQAEASPPEEFARQTIARLKAEARRLLAKGDVSGAAQRAQAILVEQVKPLFGDPCERGVAGTLLAAWDSGAIKPDEDAVAMAGLDRKEQRRKECETNAAQYGFRLEDLDWELEDISWMSGTLKMPTGHGKDVWGIPLSRAHLTIIDARELCQRLRCSPLTLHAWVREGCPTLRCWPWARFDLDRVQQWLAEHGLRDWPKEDAYSLERPIRAVFQAVYEGRLSAETAENIMSELGWGVWAAPLPGLTGGWDHGSA
jgi:RNA polymerase sigma-70 factor (ECF subfamily)